MTIEAAQTPVTAAEVTPDVLAFAAHSQWELNGHDVAAALLHVHRNHIDPAVCVAAGEAYDQCLAMPIVWRGFELDFAARSTEARAAER